MNLSFFHQKQKGPTQSYASAHAPRKKVSIMVRSPSTSELDLCSFKVVWEKEVTKLIHVLYMVKPTHVSVVMAIEVVSSVYMRVIS